MALKVMESSESKLALLTQVRFLLAVGEEVALQIVVPGEFRVAVRTFVLL